MSESFRQRLILWFALRGTLFSVALNSGVGLLCHPPHFRRLKGFYFHKISIEYKIKEEEKKRNSCYPKVTWGLYQVAGGILGGGFMHISRLLRNGEPRALTHLSTPFKKNPGTFHHHHFLLNKRISHTNTVYAFFRMSSSLEGNPDPKWTSQRVRDAFLDYFKKNGHTFGRWCSAAITRERKNIANCIFSHVQSHPLPLLLFRIQRCSSQMLEWTNSSQFS